MAVCVTHPSSDLCVVPVSTEFLSDKFLVQKVLFMKGVSIGSDLIEEVFVLMSIEKGHHCIEGS
jgi:hypothetical protein